MQKITPSLWFDTNCEEAMNFYVSVFPDSKIVDVQYYPEDAQDEHLQGMDGKVLHGEFELCGQAFVALDGGPVFTFNPSKSFMILCKTAEEADAYWQKLSDGDSQVLMELGEYPFSPRYGWIQDKFGLSWQVMFADAPRSELPKIVPAIMFIHGNAGKAEEARDFYLKTFKRSQAGVLSRYESGTAPDEASKVAYADFQLEDAWFAVMESGRDMHDFDLNEAVSFIIACDDQAEIDYYWDKLSGVPEAEQCGWCKDRYGVSWQVIPKNMGELIATPEAMDAMMHMHKIDIAELQRHSAS
jgi:predicted 3-demethylubiquinone-9 3-methyltransferase (glyoxalase superfamily)